LRFNVLKRKEFIYLKNWDMVLNLEGLPGLKIVAARRVCLKAPGMEIGGIDVLAPYRGRF